jgi:predicted Zn-dependent protease
MGLTEKTAAAIKDVFDHWKNVGVRISIEDTPLSLHATHSSALLKVFTQEMISYSNGSQVTDKQDSFENASLLLSACVGKDIRGSGISAAKVNEIPCVPEILRLSVDRYMDIVVKTAAINYLSGVGESIADTRPKNLHPNGTNIRSVYPENGDLSETSVFDFENDVLDQVRRICELPGLREVASEVTSERGQSLFVDTSGSEVLQRSDLQTLTFNLIGYDKGNRDLSIAKRLYFAGKETYELRKLEKEVGKLMSDFESRKNAVCMKSGAYPVLMQGSAVGTFIHETLAAHLLSGKHVTEGDSNIYSTSRLGELILPEFLSIIDDPTIKGGLGSYKYDEESVKAERIVLVENGVLNNYLLDRISAARLSKLSGEDIHSNGRSRSQNICFNLNGGLKPEPRVTNLIVDSSDLLDEKVLEEQLVRKVRDTPNLDYGLIISGVGGEVYVESGQFMLFPEIIWRVDSKGNRERVKDLALSGSADILSHQVLATGMPYKHSYGLCGSSSGDVTTQNRAPSFLIGGMYAIPGKEDTSAPPLMERMR